MKYIKGDATIPNGTGCKIIAHICNDTGAWGKGFVLAISDRWNVPERAYRKPPIKRLGSVQFIKVEDDIYVANMIAQEGIRWVNGLPPIKYTSLRVCLKEVCRVAIEKNASVHMPRIGCGLAGGKWEIVRDLIEDCLNVKDVYVYDFNITGICEGTENEPTT